MALDWRQTALYPHLASVWMPPVGFLRGGGGEGLVSRLVNGNPRPPTSVSTPLGSLQRGGDIPVRPRGQVALNSHLARLPHARSRDRIAESKPTVLRSHNAPPPSLPILGRGLPSKCTLLLQSLPPLFLPFHAAFFSISRIDPGPESPDSATGWESAAPFRSREQPAAQHWVVFRSIMSVPAGSRTGAWLLGRLRRRPCR